MSKIDDGGAAFPGSVSVSPAGDVIYGFYGMSLRDYFAAQALGAMFGAAHGLGELDQEERNKIFKAAAVIVYEAADAMLAARKREG